MLHAVILAGGKGTRFWPLSRSRKGKQFLSIIGKESLLEQTIDRIKPLVKPQNIWIVGVKDQAKHFARIKKQYGCHVLYEPVGRNTAASIGWVACEILNTDPDAVMVVLPSDHSVKGIPQFRHIIREAEKQARKDKLVTIGIVPTFPHTGFGYIEVSNNKATPAQVLAFHEKPKHDVAQKYIQSGHYFWNSGMFVWKVDTFLKLLKKHLPKSYAILSNKAKLKSRFAQLENISVDYAILEKSADSTVMFKADFEWNDLGSWLALKDFWPADSQRNITKGKKILLNSKNNIIFSNRRLVALIDVQDFIVVDHEDALLIVPKASDQKIKDLYGILPKKYQ